MKTHNIKVVEFKGDMETGYTVHINGKKYPKERGESYITNNENNALFWAIAEHTGKYLSRGGVIYDSREDYLKTIEAH